MLQLVGKEKGDRIKEYSVLETDQHQKKKGGASYR